MPKKPRHKVIESRFRRAAKFLLKDIRYFGALLTAEELALKTRTIGLIPEDEEKGDHYRSQIFLYLDGLEILKNRHSRDVAKLGTRITKLMNNPSRKKSGKKAKVLRRDLWLALATSLEPLSGRPSKKIAALLIDPNDRLIAWDGNHLCYGVERYPELYEKGVDGGRGYHIWCAERNILASFLGVSASAPKTNDLAIIHAALDKFTQSLIGAAVNNTELKTLTLVSSHYPCVPCADVIAPKHETGRIGTVGEIITLWNKATEGTLKSPTRKTKGSRKRFKKADLSVQVRYSENGCHLNMG